MQARIPPQNIEAEIAVLGTMLLVPKIIASVMSILNENDFYRESHRLIFSSIGGLFMAGIDVDAITVHSDLKNKNNLEKCGGMVYIANLTSIVPQTAHISSYCQAVLEKSKARAIIEMTAEICGRCYEGEETDDIFSDIGKFITDKTSADNKEAQPFSDIIPAVIDNIKKRSNGDEDAFGLATGFVDIDRMIGGLQKSDLIILAARPSMGKTTLAMNIACNVAKYGNKVLVFSLEMDREKLAEKQLSALSGVSWRKIQHGVHDDKAWQSIHGAAKELAKMPITVDDTAALHIQKISAKAKAFAMSNGVSLVVVDYMGLAHGSSDKREREISEISAGLKALAKHLKIPVLCLAQLNRGLESRTDKRPILSDLRDSGSIEQDADVVAFIYRDEVYNPDNGNPLKGIAEILIRKNRCGETGTVKLYFNGATSKFGNLETSNERGDNMARLKELAVGRGGDTYLFDPDDISEIPGYNVRDMDSSETQAHIRGMADAIHAGGTASFPPITIGQENGKIFVYAGYCRRRAFSLAKSEGAPVKGILAVANTQNEEERTLDLLTSNNGLPLTQIEKAKAVKRLLSFSWTVTEIAKRLGVSQTAVANLIVLIDAPKEIRDMVSSGEVSATMAINEVKKDKEKAVERLSMAVDKATSQGKTKATKKHTVEDNPQRYSIKPNNSGGNGWLVFDTTTKRDVAWVFDQSQPEKDEDEQRAKMFAKVLNENDRKHQ